MMVEERETEGTNSRDKYRKDVQKRERRKEKKTRGTKR